MTVYRNFFLAAGAVAISFLMLKLFKIQKEKTSQEINKEVNKEEKAEVNEERNIKEEKEKEEEHEELKGKEFNAVPVEIPKQKRKYKKTIHKKDREAMQYLRPKPNFFIAFQIHETGIHQKVKKLQEEIIAKNPKLYPALINISTLHTTLAVTHLANEKDIKSLKEKLDEWAEQNVTSFFQEPLILSFTGIKTFRNMVAYLDIEPCANKDRLLTLSKNVNKVVTSAGFSTDKKGFTPHVTILKLSQNYKLLKARKSFHDDFESLKNCKEHFGKQEIFSLQLLSMDEPKDEKGYYKCYHQIFVTDAKIEMDHSDCCSPIPKQKAYQRQQSENTCRV